MKTFLATLSLGGLLASSAGGQVWINEVLTNPNGTDTGNEYFELRGAANLSLAGYYLISLEGQMGGSPFLARGDINQFFDLGAYSIGANGFLFARQNSSPFTATAVGATVIQNASGAGWGLTGASTIGHSGDGTQVDLENSATTILLVNIGIGSAPTLTTDLDSNDDGLLDLPSGWSVVDSVGIMDAATPSATDFSYGAITLRAAYPAGTYSGTSAYGNIIDVPGVPPTSSGAMYVGRKGNSTGSTADDWFGAILNGSAADPLNITFAYVTDSYYQGLKLPDMVFGDANPIPEPATGALAGLGLLALWAVRRRA